MKIKVSKNLPVLIVILALMTAVAIFLINSDFMTPEEYYGKYSDDIREGDSTVFLSINCETILENIDKADRSIVEGGFIPEDGVILPETEFLLKQGESVFDVLVRAVRTKRIHMEYSGNPLDASGSVYVKGINHIYEYSCGPLSGWLFMVNGTFASADSSSYLLNDQDNIQWVYTCNLGRDVGSVIEEESRDE